MAADVFISHSSKDKHAADAACAILERRGIRCWIAPRDILPSENWGASIIEAIENSRVMVLVVSENANSSRQIEREVERAIHRGRPVIPFRIEDIEPTKALEYFISASHWLDAFTPPVEQHLDRLADVVRSILDKSGNAENAESEMPKVKQAALSATVAAKALTASKRSVPLTAIAISAVVVVAATAAFLLYATLGHNTFPVAATASSTPAPQTAPAPRGEQTASASDNKPAPIALVPEDVPFIRDFEQTTVRNDYLGAPDHKALALSFTRAGFASDKPDDKAAIAAAMDTCRAASNAVGRGYACQLYAVGNVVVYKAGRPPMPPEPWVTDDPSVSKPFTAGGTPMVSASQLSDLEVYSTAKGAKALVASSGGGFSWRFGNQSQDEAVRRSLEICGAVSGFACMVIAVDNSFVVPAPSTMKAVGFFRATTEPLIAPEMRPDLARRFGNATKGWKAVATGLRGRPSVVVNAATEQIAVEGALRDCQAMDRECRIIAIGPFRVVPRPQADKPPQTSAE
jgi:hypothetical protein